MKMPTQVTQVVGVRFDVAPTSTTTFQIFQQLKIRGGQTGIVVDHEVMCGPIYLILFEGYANGFCANCGLRSKDYKRAAAVKAWGHKHRCIPNHVRQHRIFTC